VYAEYFGLTEPPFSIAPDPRYLFPSEQHREALAHLAYGAAEGDGFIQLTGEIGTGKTTLVRRLLSEMPEAVEIAFIFNPEVSRTGLLRGILAELGLPRPAADADRSELAERLYRHLLGAHARGRRVVLVIDEAQRLGADVLEEVRLLTNFETDRRKLLNVILVGQPELRETLARGDLRQLAQRITARYHLAPLRGPETEAYIRHRLRLAGAPGRVFRPRAVSVVHRHSGGVPRLINAICDRALMAAYARGLREVTPRMVEEAVRDLAGLPARRRRRRAWWLAAALAVSALGGAALAWWGGTGRSPVPQAAGASPAAATLMDWAGGSSSGGSAAALLGLWRVPKRGGEAPCQAAQRAGLACLKARGTVRLLRAFGLPAVATLNRHGRRARVVVKAIAGGEVTLARAPGVSRRFRLDAFERVWFGQMWLLWRPPDGATMIRRGMQGAPVAWLRKALALPARTSGAAFGGDLERAVRRFQRRHGLSTDGIAGPKTLLVLERARGRAGGPSLAGNSG